MHQHHAAFENIVGKGEIARNEQFLLFPQCFLINQIIGSPFVHISDIMSLFTAELEKPKFGISGKGLKKTDFKIFWLEYANKADSLVPRSECMLILKFSGYSM